MYQLPHQHPEHHISFENDGSIPVFYRYQYDSDYNAIINSKNSVSTSSGGGCGVGGYGGGDPLKKDSSTDDSNNSPAKEDSLSFTYPLISFLFSLLHLTINTTLVYLFYVENQHTWFILTLSLLVVPLCMVNIFSIKWYIQDYRSCEPCAPRRPSITPFQWIMKIFAHLLLIGHIFRYFDLLFFTYKCYSLKRKEETKKCTEDFYLSILQHSANLTHNSTTINSKPVKENNESDEYVNYYLLTINEDRDTALLSLIKSFSQSTPIIILQTYIIASTTTNLSLQRTIVMLQLASILTCLICTSWSLASYHRALRRSIPEKGNMTSYGVILSFLWRLGTLTCRTMSIGLFVSAFSYWILPITIGHWGIMTIWVMHQGTHFCRYEQSEYLFNMVLGLLYLFEFLNIKDEPTRYKYTAYYCIMVTENLILTGLWYIKVTRLESPIHHLSALTIYAGLTSAFALGIVFMLIYYRFAHPNGKLLWVNKAAKCC